MLNIYGHYEGIDALSLVPLWEETESVEMKKKT